MPAWRGRRNRALSRWRKKPVTVEAERFLMTDNSVELFERGLVEDRPFMFLEFRVERDNDGFFIAIPTLEGTMKARSGDWIITGITGEKYPCKHSIFEATYEPAD